MKYAVFAALVASSSALTGCKKGIEGKFYSDAKCSEKSHSSFRFMEKDVKDTGKCKQHHSSEDDNKALATAKKDLNTAEAATKVELMLSRLSQRSLLMISLSLTRPR